MPYTIRLDCLDRLIRTNIPEKPKENYNFNTSMYIACFVIGTTGEKRTYIYNFIVYIGIT